MSGFLSNKILDKDFKRAMRGYSVEEVDEFLDELADDFENNTREINGLKERLTIANEKLKKFEQLEKNIQGTLLLAQSTAENSKVQAVKEAELILREAEEQASKKLMDAEKENQKLHYENERIRSEFSLFRRRIIGFMEAQVDSFKNLSLDLERENISTTLSAKNKSMETKKSPSPTPSIEAFNPNMDMGETQAFHINSVFGPEEDEDIKIVG